MDPLAELKDIHLPADVAPWPPAYGWWLLLIISLLLLTAAVYLYHRYRQRRLAKRQALKAIDGIDANQPDWPSQLNQIFKRAVLSYYPAQGIVSLHGEQWAGFLSAQLPEKYRQPFNAVITPLQQSLYTNSHGLDFAQSRAQAQLWINKALPPSGSAGGADV